MTAPHDERDDHEGRKTYVDHDDDGDDRVEREERHGRETHDDGEDRIEREDRPELENGDGSYQREEELESERDPDGSRHDGDREEERPTASDGFREGDRHPESDSRDPPQGPSSEEPKISDKGDPEKDSADASKDDQGAPEIINLFVRNVAKHVIEEQLVELFSKYGKVDSAVVVRDPHSKECRGFGFVKMVDEDEAAQAIEGLRDFEFEGRRIAVEKAKRKAPHSRTPGAYMGIDRRIKDRYAGMKRSRDYEGGYGYEEGHGMGRRGGYRGRYEGDGPGRYDDRGWDPRDQRAPSMRPLYDDRERVRRRYESNDPRQERNIEREQRFTEREPPVPREPADDYV